MTVQRRFSRAGASVKTKQKVWPAQKPVDASTTVELVGEYDTELIGESHFDVKEIRPP